MDEQIIRQLRAEKAARRLTYEQISQMTETLTASQIEDRLRGTVSTTLSDLGELCAALDVNPEILVRRALSAA